MLNSAIMYLMKNRYAELFDYLSTPDLPQNPEPAILFGRKDPLVAKALGDLILPGLITDAVITGGIGKDSGDIVALGYTSEAEYLKHHLDHDQAERGYDMPRVLIEPNARNGGENARFSLGLLRGGNMLLPSLTAVAHATSARRLAEMVRHAAMSLAPEIQHVHVKPSAYVFDPRNPSDQKEAVAEMIRLADWPAKGWLLPQDAIPQNLVDFSKDIEKSQASRS